VLAAIAAVSGCRSREPAPAPGPTSGPLTGPNQNQKPTARAVLQPLGFDSQRIVTPARVWDVTTDNGITVVDGERGVGVASFFTPYPLSDVVLTEDGKDAIALFHDARFGRAGQLADQEVVGLLLERWSLATRTRRWSVPMPPMSKAGSTHRESLDHLTWSAQGLYVTRCLRSYRPESTCSVWKVDAGSGALGPGQAFSTPRVPDVWNGPRVDAKNRGVSLRQTRDLPGKPRRFQVFDATGRTQGAFSAACARFDDGDTLWLEAPVNESLGILGALGITTRSGPRACVPDPPMAKQSRWGGVADQTYPVIAGDRVAWQLLDPPMEAFSLDITAAALPVRLELSPENPARPESRWHLQRSSQELYAAAAKRFAYWPPGAVTPELGSLPHDGFLWNRAGAVLLGYWPGNSADIYSLSLGTRARAGEPLKWRNVAATSNMTPGFTLTAKNGKKVVVVAGGRSGIQRADAASGALLSRTCTAPGDKTGICPAGEKYAGLVASSNGEAAWTYHERRDVPGMADVFEFLEIDLATGSTLRTLRAPPFAFFSSDGYKAGWLKPDTRFWYAAADAFGTMRTCAVFVTVPPAPAVNATYDGLCLPGRVIASDGDPAGRFFASFRVPGTIDFFAPDGEEVLLVRAFRGGDALAQTRDGRFACTGAACDELRCVTGDEVRAISDPSCAHLRAPGFSLLEELGKPRP
jgi:hypothetical protein